MNEEYQAYFVMIILLVILIVIWTINIKDCSNFLEKRRQEKYAEFYKYSLPKIREEKIK